MQPAVQAQDEELNHLIRGRFGNDKKLNAELRTMSKAKREFEKNLRQNDLLLKESGGY